jgi:Xaa-Pro aminopeptidase
LTEFEQRRRTLGLRLAENKVGALLVTSPASVRYLALPGEGHFFTDPRYALEAAQEITCKVHVAKGPLHQTVAQVIKRKKLKKIGFDPTSVSHEQFKKLNEAMTLGASLVVAGKLVEEQRAIKSASEIATIRRSVAANSEAFARTIKRVKVGVREQDIAAELEFQMRVQGAEKPAFDTIVAMGERSALPHARPGPHRLAANELLLIDAGATLEGYASDMTRMAFAGDPPKRIRDLYRAVLEAQLAAVSAVRAGVEANKVDRAARDVLKRHKLEREFVHSTGHGLGLEIHEMPRVGRKDKTRLRAGMAITIEPGAYIEGLGGVRIEDTVLVTEKGCEVLTPTSKDLVTL